MNAPDLKSKTGEKLCLSCGKTVKGRADKKFCDDNCRNLHNNQVNAGHNNCIRHINSMLRRNRRILEQLITPGESSRKIKKEQLIRTGFLFQYHTHSIAETDRSYLYCYEFGLCAIDTNLYMLVRSDELV